METNKDYGSFDYRVIEGDDRELSVALDAFESFGWVVDESAVREDGRIALRRSRALINRMELTRLQRNYESCLNEIRALDQSVTGTALTAAGFTAAIGLVFTAVALLFLLGAHPIYPAALILGIPGVVLLAAVYPLFRLLRSRRAAVVAPLREKKYDEIFILCKKGQKLL